MSHVAAREEVISKVERPMKFVKHLATRNERKIEDRSNKVDRKLKLLDRRMKYLEKLEKKLKHG